MGAEFVVEGVVEGEQIAQFWAQLSLDAGGEELLLILLLRLIAAAIKTVQGESIGGGGVLGSGVPEVGVHHHDIA